MGEFNQVERFLYLYTELYKGNTVNKQAYMDKFHVSDASFNKDIRKLKDAAKHLRLEFDIKVNKKESYYYLDYASETGGNLSDIEAYTLSKILLESRALSKKKTKNIIRKLINRTVNENYRTILEKQSENELSFYKQLNYFNDEDHDQNYLNNLSKLSQAVEDTFKKKIPIKIKYSSKGETKDALILPFAILFHEYYFYITSYKFENGEWVSRTYRLDRVESISDASGKEIVKAQAFFHKSPSPSLIRDQVIMMFSGKPYLIRLKIIDKAITEYLKDALPTLQVIDEEEAIYEIRTSGVEGIQLFLRRYGSQVEFVSMTELNTDDNKG
ncbi:helix-turn-helix transcriptional regulator [Streptococcus ferus]|uniref:helix-turn-helix transcriptional regulator n=1 Tax=Streptococcus ferus TaxID=1345 RepID=UPI0023561684|nr:WYL domain-containing protein [Streptococcus ferus]